MLNAITGQVRPAISTYARLALNPVADPSAGRGKPAPASADRASPDASILASTEPLWRARSPESRFEIGSSVCLAPVSVTVDLSMVVAGWSGEWDLKCRGRGMRESDFGAELCPSSLRWLCAPVRRPLAAGGCHGGRMAVAV